MIRKIAIFRALYLGDMLCIIPAIRAIRKAYPQARIYLIGLPWQADFAARFPAYFDHFIEFPGWPGLPEQQPDAGTVVRFLDKIRAYRFDIIFQMQGNGLITNSMCMLWNGKTVCGLRREGEYAPDAKLFPVSEDGEHEVLRFLKLLDAMAIARQGTHLEFPLQASENARVEGMLRQAGLVAGQYVCLHPGARDERRRWPVENFAVLADEIAARGIRVVLTGSEEERSLLQDLQQRANQSLLNTVETFGHLSAGELAAFLKQSRLLISNDTGVSHIAAALGLPSIIIFSRHSAFSRWRPLDINKHIAIPFEKAGHQNVLRCVSRALNASVADPELRKADYA